MANRTVSGTLFKKMVTNGAVNLKNNHKEIDHLNVFPVPDGDTGTNMQMTMMAGVKEVNSSDSQSIVDVSKILSKGLLMGARGNSGVILSQFFRGVSSEIAKLDHQTASVSDFIQALIGGYQMAYRAVMDPVEGTILTVARESAEKVLNEQSSLDSVEDVLKLYLEQAKETLDKTPELLPVLKEAGVVDSGGAGFIKIIEGMLMALEGEMLNEAEASSEAKTQEVYHGAQNLGEVDIRFGYCTEFIIKLNRPERFEEKFLKDPLSQMGDSLVLVTDDDLVKVHVHTNQPGVALTLAQKYGEIQTTKIENMRVQHSSIMVEEPKVAEKVVEKPKEHQKYAIIAVANGEGIQETFRELGVEIVIDGGQTMNPSTEDFVKAVESLNADNVILLPNNSNIILAAEQTLDLLPDRMIRVVKSKSVAQGYSSLMAFDPTQPIDANVEEMTEVIKNMKSGEITYSIRDTEMNGVSIKENDFIGISQGEIKVSNPDRLKAVNTLIESMLTDESEILTIFYGLGVEEDEVEEVVAATKKLNPDLEIEIVDGKQDVYSYIIAVE